ncbi:MAG: WXG100 family type VII secretion target, partial [Bryobacteraceae bacterium]
MAWQDRVEVEIEELGRFRTLLKSAAAQLREVHAGLERHVEKLSKTWRDEHQRRFTDAFAETSGALTVFAASAERYAFYLWQKAEAVAAYTDSAPPDAGGANATLGPASWAGTAVSPAESAFKAAVAVAAAAVRVSAESLLSTWDSLDPDERLKELGQIQAKLAAAQGRPAIPVRKALMNPKCLGFFDGRTIRLNLLWLVEGMGHTMLETLIHE